MGMRAWSDRLMIVMFVGSLFAMMAVFIISPKIRFSELENRVLQSRPEFTWSSLINDQFTHDTESYISDHFPLREHWIQLKSVAEQLRLQQENNGIYKGKDGYLFEAFFTPDFEKVAAFISRINELAQQETGSEVTLMLVPTSVGMYPDKLPWLATAYPQEEVHAFIADNLDSNVALFDGFDFLRPHAADADLIYYRTDHHWTTYGAYWGYKEYAESMGWTPLEWSNFNVHTVSETFLGSFHTKGLFSGVRPDSIQRFQPLADIDSEVIIYDNGTRMDSLYDERYLGKKDQYAYFLGGVHALMMITNQADSGDIVFDLEKLLIIKDSYAHNFIPFLAPHVREIHVIDPRYYNGNISEYMIDHDIRDVLMLFNTVTVTESGGMLKP